MKAYRSILACIDDVDRDAKMIHYIENIIRMAGTEEVHLMYVSEDLWRPVYSASSTMAETRLDAGIPPIPDIPLDEQKERVHVLAMNTLGHLSDCRIKTHVVYGSPLYEILDYALTRNVDVIAMRQTFGEASEKGSKALLPRRITRRATCSTLTIPDNFSFETPNILVPIRNSECSQNAFIAACNIVEATGGILEALNIYQVHSDYMLAGLTLSDHLNNLESYAKLETQTLLDRTVVGNVEVRTHFMPDFNADPVKVVSRRARENDSNMIVIGARGRTGAAGVLLGTVTEQLIQTAAVPVLAVKKKGECIGVLKAMLEVMGFKK